MPGPQDRVLKPTPAPDHVPPGQSDISKEGNRPAENDAPREARGEPRADLRERLKRLPPNHPSSPLRGDGSRNPVSPDGTRDALTTSDPEDQTDQGLDAQDRARIDPDGSWHWKGRDLLPEPSRIGDSTVEECREAEGRDADGNYGDHGLTPAMRGIEAELEHGKLVDKTAEYALKSANRFKEKLAKLIDRYPGADPKELAHEIHDGIRYTLIFEFEHYTESVEHGQTKLADAGYVRIETKPSWHADEYKGVNSRWCDPASRLMFEVQFHTQESWDAKQKTHDAYEKIGTLNIPIEEAEQLRTYQRQVSAAVRIPPGALEIQPYKKEE